MILSDGTRIIEKRSDYRFPHSIDLKVTGYCTHACPFCHESSDITGKHSDPDLLLFKLSNLPNDTEVAIGGGNPLEHPELQKIIDGLGCIVNITVRDIDVSNLRKISGITAAGISIGENIDPGKTASLIPPSYRDNMVAHLILGITSLDTYREVKKWFPRILWLGFKTWGRNKDANIPDMSKIEREISRDIYSGRYGGILAFDNLAINQIHLKDKLLKSEWEAFYQGPEFSISMYVDGVNGFWAPNSTSDDKTSWDLITLSEYYVKGRTI